MRSLFSILFLGFAGVANAQGVEMADALRSNGKIYVIVLIIMIVLGGLITYLFLMDRKLDKIEKQLNAKAPTKSTPKSF